MDINRILERLTGRELRAVRIGALLVAAVLAATVVPNWWVHWKGIRRDLAQMQGLVEQASTGRFNPAGLASMVPVFEMPADLETQKTRFRDEVARQLREAGMPNAPLQVEPANRQKIGGFSKLALKYKATCRLEQLIDFLVLLKQNPYYAGIDELTIRGDTKTAAEERQTVDVEITISTFVR